MPARVITAIPKRMALAFRLASVIGRFTFFRGRIFLGLFCSWTCVRRPRLGWTILFLCSSSWIFLTMWERSLVFVKEADFCKVENYRVQAARWWRTPSERCLARSRGLLQSQATSRALLE